ncbi:FimV/HubP family polar landmark protein [Alcanivorax sp.]|uniref:FimV/HubP family polar landmark protein n=1 Tax=Alcanivorax sp. TaxID=1872427 RepID=UPI0025C07C5E|nr:FimV/HubP family polar landmark protein [Alcanivorax sp.]
MLRKLGFGLTAVAMMAPGVAAALGVGEYQLNSYLNQPLDMDVSLHEVGDLTAEEILVNLAPQSEFDAAGVDRSYFLNRLAFSVELQEGDKAQLHISTDQPVREPYLNFLVEFLWPTGRLMREYTVLLDPPSFADSAVTAAPTISRVPQPVTRSEPTPASAPAPAATPTPQPESTPEPAIESEPQQAQSAPAVADSGPRSRYTVRSSDTMWQIALNNRPSNSVSVQQMLVAIQEMNPDAFINNNVNLVREGTVLRIPNEQEVRNISTRSAIVEVADQNRQWRDMLEKRGIQTPQRAQIDGSRQVADSDDEAEAPTRGEVKLVAPESTAGVDDGDSTGSDEQGNANTAVLENELAIRDESLDRLDRENSELKSRLSDLEAQNSTSEELLKLRNDQITQLQEELRQLREEQGVASPDNDPLMEEPAEPALSADADDAAGDDEANESIAAADSAQEDGEQTADDDVAVLEGSDEQAAEQSGVTDAADAEGPQSAADSAGNKEAEADSAVKPVEPVSKPEPVAPAQPPVAQSGGIVDLIMENLLYIALGLLAILLLIALLLRGKKKNDNEDLDGPLFDDVDDQQDDEFGLNLDDDSAPTVAAVDDNADDAAPVQGQGGSQDPLEDVEVYVAYGRYPQAVDFLRNEINKSPERADLKVRLLELLKEMGDDAAFQQQATTYAGTGADVDAAIARLGGAAAPAAAQDDDELSLDDLEMGLSSDLGNGSDSAPTIEAEAPSLEPETESTDELADFDFELDSAEADNEDATVMLNADSETSSSSANAQDDDFSLDFDSEDDAVKEPEMSDADKQSMSADSLLELDDVGSATLQDDTEFGELNLDDMNAEFDDLSAEPAADEELDLSLDDLDLSDETGSAPQSSDDDTLSDLDIDLELDEAEKSLSGSTQAEESLDDITALDLDAPLEEAAPVADTQIDADEVAAADDGSLEDLLGDDELNLDDDQTLSFDAPEAADADVSDAQPQEETVSIEPTVAPAAPVDETPAPSSADVLADEDDFDFLGETDENATKLDLAKAYIDMGDNEGAKDILNEVISEGNDQQQSEARELLSQVG